MSFDIETLFHNNEDALHEALMALDEKCIEIIGNVLPYSPSNDEDYMNELMELAQKLYFRTLQEFVPKDSLFQEAMKVLKAKLEACGGILIEENHEIYRAIYTTQDGSLTIFYMRPNGVIIEESDDGVLHSFETLDKYAQAW